MKSTSIFLQKLGFTGPGVLVNETQARANIKAMHAKAQAAGIGFRPHFKTHQSADVGRWFADEGIKTITVSSVEMAEYFAAHGWNDITIAFLLNPLQWPQIETLASTLNQRDGQLALTVDSLAAAEFIASRSNIPLQVWIKVDAGYGRTGVHWQDDSTLRAIVEVFEPENFPVGLLTHSGDSYHAHSGQDISAIWNTTLERMESAALGIRSLVKLSISVGDTPCCRSVDDLSGVQEIRPGNFVFFDLMQWSHGVCETRELAMAAVCPVVGLYPERGRVVVHGGAVHLSREYLDGENGQPVFGYSGTLKRNDDGSFDQQILNEIPVTSLSQEHGTIEVSKESFTEYFGELAIGDLILIWPVHSCLTCDLAPEYRTMSGTILEKE